MTFSLSPHLYKIISLDLIHVSLYRSIFLFFCTDHLLYLNCRLVLLMLICFADKSFQRSDSQSSVERNQEDSDGRESESDSSRCSRRRIASSRANRNNDDSGSESGKSIRSRPGSPRTFKSQDESDGRASDSDTGNSRSRRITSFENSAEKNKRKDSEPDLVKTEGQSEDSLSVKKPPRVRKLSRNKLMNKIEASPLSHSWTPGAIEKIVKSWRETKSPVSQEKSKEEEKALKPVSHVQFF